MTLIALWEDRYPVKALPDCDENCQVCPAFLGGQGCLIQKKLEIGSVAFDREFLCNPRTSISSLFPYELFEANFNKDAVVVNNYSGLWKTVAGIDIARSEKIGSDWFVIFILGLEWGKNKRHVLNIQRSRGLTFDEQLDEIMKVRMNFGCEYIVIESDMNQDLWTSQGRKKYPGIPVLEHRTGGIKGDLTAGIPSLLVPMEQGLYEIPRGDQDSKDVTDIWIGEGMAFGWVNDKLEGVGEHDDTIVAWWKAEVGIQKLIKGVWKSGKLNMRKGVEI